MIDLKVIENLVRPYIKKNFREGAEEKKFCGSSKRVARKMRRFTTAPISTAVTFQKFQRMKDLLAVKSNLADVIVSFFIEYKIYDVDSGAVGKLKSSK